MKITSKQDEKSSENQNDSEDNSQPRKSRWPLIATGVALALSLVVGAGVGLLVQRPQKDVEPSTSEVPPPEDTPVDPRENVVLADTALANGEVTKAIALYQQSKSTLATQPRLLVPLLYKLASAQEAAGNYELALKHYRNINQQDLSPISIAAKLGEARVLFQLGQPKIAINELAPLAMISAAPELELTEAGMLLRYTSALIGSAQAQADLPKNPVHHEHLFQETMPAVVASAIRLLETGSEQLGTSLKRPELGLQVLGNSEDPETTLLSCQFPTQPAALLMEMLAQQTGWNIDPSRQAIEMLSAKRVEMQLRDKTAGEMLSLLLEPLDLYWSFRDRTLRIDRAENFPTIYRKTQLRRRTLFALQDALSLAPNHEMAPQAYLALGNLAVIDSQFDRAATHYRDLEQRFPKSEMAPLSKFNRAKTLMMQSKQDAANDVFYSVMDEPGESPAKPLAYFFVGSTFLERENFRAAKRELSRCASLAVRDEVRAPAAMTLATTYLLENQGGGNSTANAVLMDYQDALRRASWQNEAVFLTALIQYRVATKAKDVRRRGHELITAAIKVDPNAYFGNFGHLMVGNAFSDLEVTSEAINVFSDGIQKTRSETMRDRLKYRLASEYRKLGDTPSAIPLLQDITAAGTPKWVPKAYLELADILLTTQKFDECITVCRRGLDRGFSEDLKKRLLHSLGTAYEELGRFQEASYCYAGFLPTKADDATVLTAELPK